MPREITLGLAFTDAELTRAILLLQEDPENFHQRAKDEIIKPVLPRINAALSQDNDPDWLAHFLRYALVKTRERIESTTTENQDEDRQGRDPPK